MTMPLISVLMPAYNCEAVLAEAAGCVLAQTLSDFELIIVDDGSRDGTLGVIESLARQDARVRYVSQPNAGAGAALNHALDLARGTYFARMDADDLTPPTRFADQVAFMEAHPEIAIVSGWYRTFGAIEGRVHELPTEPGHIKAVLLFRSSLCHANAMYRGEAFRTHHWRYDTRRRYPEDYDLWARMAAFHEFANLPKVLLDYRIWPGCSGQHHMPEWEAHNLDIQCGLLGRMGVTASAAQRELHGALAFDRIPADAAFLTDAHAWLRAILSANDQAAFFQREGLMRALTGRYIALVKAAAKVGGPIYDELMESPFRSHVQITLPMSV